MTFNTDIIGYDLEKSGGWTPDCQNKQDYDPDVIRISCRVYPDGGYNCALLCGDDTLVGTGHQEAGSVEAAKTVVETWCAEKAAIVRKAVEIALKAPTP